MYNMLKDVSYKQLITSYYIIHVTGLDSDLSGFDKA